MEKKLFFEGEFKLRSVTNYGVLLTLATIIATYGVISGSTAIVMRDLLSIYQRKFLATGKNHKS